MHIGKTQTSCFNLHSIYVDDVVEQNLKWEVTLSNKNSHLLLHNFHKNKNKNIKCKVGLCPELFL